MNKLLARLKLYEPLFGLWYIDYIAIKYDDMAWVYLSDGNNDALMKVKTLYCQEDEVETAIYHLMRQYDNDAYPDLSSSSYLAEEHYYIEEDNYFKGVDVCLLSEVSQLVDEDVPLLADDQFKLGLAYLNGEDGYVQDEYYAFELLEKAALNHHYRAMCSLGYLYEIGLGVKEDKAKAVELYLHAAQNGDDLAACNYAYCAYEGLGMEMDEDKAFEYFEIAAADQVPRALYYLGECYCFGRGTKKDEIKAMYYYQQAVDQGFLQAKYSVGYCYEMGIGVEKNLEQAFSWYHEAADEGLDIAQLQVGYYYEAGIGVE